MIKKSNQPRKKKKIQNTIDISTVNSHHFVDRDLSWLSFNERVLYQAIDTRNPLLERVRFLGIFSSNLDEFYMKRVGELKRKMEVNPTLLCVNGQTVTQEFDAIRASIISSTDKMADCFQNGIRQDLSQHNIHLLEWKELTKDEVELATKFFRENLFPILTPLAVDLSHPFPFISNLSLSLGLALQHPDNEEIFFARVKIPKTIPQWVLLYDNKEFKSYRFVSILDIVSNNLHLLFTGMKVMGIMPFRITRNADWDPEDKNSYIVQRVEEAIKDRKFAECIRLQYFGLRDEWMINLLKEVLEIKEEDIYQSKFILDYVDLKILLDLDLPQLKYKTWSPVTPHFVSDDPNHFFSEIKRQDILVHHPYESFSATVEKFIRLAAIDPQVMAIKMTLYRTSEGSLFVKSLIQAAERGKQVVCLIELQARFDEERNIHWGHELEQAGVHVIYGVTGLKTHTKTALVIRKESDHSLCTYAHIGTGNYHTQTSNLYTDLGIFTTHKPICDDLIQLFHFITGRSLNNTYQHLLVAPFNMKTRFLEMIDREIEHARSGKEALIIAKMNSMDEIDITEKLYQASNAGVKIILIVRGFCTLKPQIPGLSENIHVYSVIGRFLEHSRLFYFKNQAAEAISGEFYLGSADWMHRNLQNRVEVITPIYSRDLKIKCWHFIETVLNDHRLLWEMQADGTYKLRQPPSEAETSTHEVLMQQAIKSIAIT